MTELKKQIIIWYIVPVLAFLGPTTTCNIITKDYSAIRGEWILFHVLYLIIAVAIWYTAPKSSANNQSCLASQELAVPVKADQKTELTVLVQVDQETEKLFLEADNEGHFNYLRTVFSSQISGISFLAGNLDFLIFAIPRLEKHPKIVLLAPETYKAGLGDKVLAAGATLVFLLPGDVTTSNGLTDWIYKCINTYLSPGK